MTAEQYKIMVVDDEIWVRENLKRQIETSGFRIDGIELASNGEEALNGMAGCRPDILITDINMPFINGIELIKKARSIHNDMVVIVLSGYSDFGYVREALLEGAIDYILKPISQANLENILAKAMKAVDSKRQKSAEMQENNEKLLLAASILFDREMSERIDGEERKNRKNISYNKLSDMELTFAKYNLVLIKTDNLNNMLKRISGATSHVLLFKIKNIILQEVDGGSSIVFNNTYVPNEFILIIADRDAREIAAVEDRLIRKLQEFTGFYISIACSSSYFSFDRICDAYNETLLAMLTRRYRPGNYRINAANVEKVPIAKFLTAEQENQIIFAVQSNNKRLLRTILEGQIIKVLGGKDMLFLEVKQTMDKIAWIILHYSANSNTPSEILESETLIEMLNIAVEKFDLPNAYSVLDQIIDGTLKENETYSSNETIKKTVEAIKKHISENYFEDLSLTSLARQFLVDRSYLSKAFKYETGENLMLFIAKKRIEKATDLILEGKVTLSEISYLVGYEDYAYFNRVFRKITGKSPREYKASLEM
jgi:YesN/AraC family two-component response regulator